MTRYDFYRDLTRPIVTQLPACPEPIPKNCALTRVGEYQILLTGGTKKNSREVSAEAFLLDIRQCKWLAHPSVPNLNEARVTHSSCSNKTHALVFGGYSGTKTDPVYFDSFEQLSLEQLESFGCWDQ